MIVQPAHQHNEHRTLQRAREIAQRAWATWQIPEPDSRIQFEFSNRLTRSLALSYPDRRLVRLHRDLLHADAAVFRQVVIHEAAHIAARVLHGPNLRPHGSRWQQLVRRAGEHPSVRIESTHHAQPIRKRQRWLHRCPVCQSARIAARRVTRWRCERCRDAGLDGQLEITALERKCAQP